MAVISDTGTGHPAQYQIASQIQNLDFQKPLDAIIHSGDLVYNSAYYKPYDLWRKFEHPYRSLLEGGIPFYFALGNHDKIFSKFYMKYPPLNMRRQKYHKQVLCEGLCDIFLLDSNPFISENVTEESKQIKWLKENLSESKALWKIPVLHHPPYNYGNIYGMNEHLIDTLVPIFKQYGVRIVFSGHEHIYERIQPEKDGIIYFVTGSGGNLSDRGFTISDKLEMAYDHNQAFLFLEIDNYKARFQAINMDGETVDTGVIPLSVDKDHIHS